MLSIVFIAKANKFNGDQINKWLLDNNATIQERDGKPRFLSSIQVAEKTIDGYHGVIMAATLDGDKDHTVPTETLFIAVGDEFGIGELDPQINSFVQDLQCFGWVNYHAHHGDMDCISFRVKCSEKLADRIMADGNYKSMHISK